MHPLPPPPPNLNFGDEHHNFVNQSDLGDIHGPLDVVAIASRNKHTMRKIDDSSRIANPTIEVCIHKPHELYFDYTQRMHMLNKTCKFKA